MSYHPETSQSRSQRSNLFEYSSFDGVSHVDARDYHHQSPFFITQQVLERFLHLVCCMAGSQDAVSVSLGKEQAVSK